MKTDLIILHGALGCKDQFIEWAEAFSERYTCHIFDFSGHGTKSGEEKSLSIELFSEELNQFVSRNNLAQPHVIGYSMGGYVALYTALKKGNILGKVMTVATKFNWTPETSIKEAGYLKPELMRQKVPQLAEQLKQRHGQNWERVVKRTAEMMLALGANPLLTTANLIGIKTAVKFCVGDKDKMVSIAETQAMHQALPDSLFCAMPGTGHLPERMNLKRIVFEVDDFLLNQ